MLRYHPIDAGIHLDALQSDLLCFDWTESSEDFLIPDDKARVLRVAFRNDVVARMLDEMALSVALQSKEIVGFIANHFAYRVEGDSFWRTEIESWVYVHPVEHYRFVTGGGCLDVLTSFPPAFTLVERGM